MDIWRYRGLNNCVSPECVSVDIVTQVNSASSDTGPLSLQMLEEASNKCWEKLLICSVKLHQQSPLSWISWINNLIFLKVKFIQK